MSLSETSPPELTSNPKSSKVVVEGAVIDRRVVAVADRSPVGGIVIRQHSSSETVSVVETVRP